VQEGRRVYGSLSSLREGRKMRKAALEAAFLGPCRARLS
jgi:hypothetical protein